MTLSTAGANHLKQITPENWLSIDPTWAGTVLFSDCDDPPQGWVCSVLEVELDAKVPEDVRTLFGTARGALIYGLMYYPLLTLGEEQLLRVLESALTSRSTAMGAPSTVTTFAKKIQWLIFNAVIKPEEQGRWHAIRQLRNSSSHPIRQQISTPGQALSMLCITAELINSLFRLRLR